MIITGYNSWDDIFKDWDKLTPGQKEQAYNILNHNGEKCYVGERWGFSDDYQLHDVTSDEGCLICDKFSHHRFGMEHILCYSDTINGDIILNKIKLKRAVIAFNNHWNTKHVKLVE